MLGLCWSISFHASQMADDLEVQRDNLTLKCEETDYQIHVSVNRTLPSFLPGAECQSCKHAGRRTANVAHWFRAGFHSNRRQTITYGTPVTTSPGGAETYELRLRKRASQMTQPSARAVKCTIVNQTRHAAPPHGCDRGSVGRTPMDRKSRIEGSAAHARHRQRIDKRTWSVSPDESATH